MPYMSRKEGGRGQANTEHSLDVSIRGAEDDVTKKQRKSNGYDK